MAINNSINKLLLTVITESTTARTLSIADGSSTILTTNTGGDTTITIPIFSSVPIPTGAIFRFINQGGGTRLLFFITTGLTIIGTQNLTLGNNGFIEIEKIATNTWQIVRLHEELITTVALVGPFSGNLSCKLIRNNNVTTFWWNDFTGTSTTVAKFTGTLGEFRFRPANTNNFIVWGQNLGVNTLDTFSITSAGAITIGNGATGGNFNGTGIATLWSGAITYLNI